MEDHTGMRQKLQSFHEPELRPITCIVYDCQLQLYKHVMVTHSSGPSGLVL